MESYLQMLHEDLVDFRYELKESEDVFKACNEKLLSKKYVNNGFYDAVTEREKQYPTGLKFENVEIAIPHTDIQYINTPFIYVNKLIDCDVSFVHMGTDDQLVKPEFVIILGITDPKEQVNLLSFLMKLFSDDQFISDIQQAENEKQLFNVFVEGIRKGEEQ